MAPQVYFSKTRGQPTKPSAKLKRPTEVPCSEKQPAKQATARKGPGTGPCKETHPEQEKRR